MTTSDPWIDSVELKIRAFARQYRMAYQKSSRQIAAAFEIGCFHSLLEFYSSSSVVTPQNLTPSNEYRYLTSPNGNPANFSFVRISHPSGDYDLRQQVRIVSHLDSDIAFTPDMVVFPTEAAVNTRTDKDYAGGKRSFFFLRSADVVAAHECKSMNPFPELLVSFVGLLQVAHKWLDLRDGRIKIDPHGIHLAPSLFVGGSARALHNRMISALQRVFPLNIISGLHAGNWKLSASTSLKRLAVSPTPSSVPALTDVVTDDDIQIVHVDIEAP